MFLWAPGPAVEVQPDLQVPLWLPAVDKLVAAHLLVAQSWSVGWVVVRSAEWPLVFGDGYVIGSPQPMVGELNGSADEIG